MRMKKTLFSAAMCVMATAAMAQETYDNAQLMTEDLNGTARYVGMGGAMDALGADISTMNSNPAGIGLFRRSWFGFSAGATIQNGDKVGAFNKSGVTNADLNQIGFVYCNRVGSNSAFNIGFNFHKSRNFNQISTAINSLNGTSSLNKAALSQYMTFAGTGDDYDPDYGWNGSTRMGRMVLNNVNDRLDDDYWTYRGASAYGAQTENSGYISNFNFNLSGNINDRVYLGLTMGIKDVHFNSDTYYGEDLYLEEATNNDGGYASTWDSRTIRGTGFDIKAGAIFRPIDESPFRFGFYIHTPTWYELDCTQHLSAASYLVGIDYPKTEHTSNMGRYSYEYKITTPWKFGFTLGQTFGKMVALGATYEYADYGITTNRVKIGERYNGWGYTNEYDRDYDMDKNTKQALKGVHLVKLGMEVKPVPEVAIRVGYNYQSAMYDMSGTKCINDEGNSSYYIDPYYSDGAFCSTYDYTNWKATQRVTFGLGFNLGKNVNLDLSYQYATQKGEYHPFASTKCYQMEDIDPEEDGKNIGTVSEVKNNRHQINATLGIRF